MKNNKKKTIEDHGKKEIDALADLKPKEMKPREIKPNRYSDYFIDKKAKIRSLLKIKKYTFKDQNNAPINFIGFKGPRHF